jgi:hypothetical protein
MQHERGKKNAYRLLVGNPERKILLAGPRHMWVNNIEMDLGEIEWDSVDWIRLAHDMGQWRNLVNMVMNLRVSMKC